MTGSLEDFEARGPYLRKRTPPDVPGRHLRLVAGSVLAAAGLWLLLGSDAGIVRVVLLQKRAAALDREIAALTAERKQLRQRLDRLANDRATFERVARESYGLARPDEIVFLLPGHGDGPSWRQAPAPDDLVLPGPVETAPELEELPLDTPLAAR